MAERNDEYQTHNKEYLERQKELVSGELEPEHSNLILDFLYDNDDDLASSTARNYCRELRFLIRYTYGSDVFNAKPEEWDSDDWNRLIRRVMRQRDAGDGTRRNTAYAVRKFITWSIESDADKSEIDAPKRTHEKIDQETVLSPDEVVGLIDTD